MADRSIHIGNLQIRLPRSAAGQAQEVAARLGRDILRSLGESAIKKTGKIEIGTLPAVTIGISDVASAGSRVAAQAMGGSNKPKQGQLISEEAGRWVS